MKSLVLLLFCSVMAVPVIGAGLLSVVSGGAAFGSIISSAAGPGVAYNTIIPIQDANALLTKKIVRVYQEEVSVMGFLRSFFTVNETMSKHISIAVQRAKELVAVDVYTNSSGNRNTFDKSTEKIYRPAYYHEWFDMTELDLYDQAMQALFEGNTAFFAELTTEAAKKLFKLQQKIERAVELQCAQVLTDGILQLKAGGNIDFKRKAASLVDKGAGNYWDNPVISPYTDLKDGCQFLRETGKSQGDIINGIFGAEALDALLMNKIVLDRSDIKDFSMDSVNAPQRDSVGAFAHGVITCGSYKVRIWSYPETYDDKNGVAQPYIDPKKVILVPSAPKFDLNYAAVKQLIGAKQKQNGMYLIQDFMNEEEASHKLSIKSAPIAVPTAVDQIYTVKVVA